MAEGIPEPYRGPPTKLMRLHAWFAAHPHGRLLEFGFWAVPGGLFMVIAWAGWTFGWMAAPIALLFVVFGVCLIAFGALPQKRPAAPPPRHPKSKRGARK